MRTEHEKIGGKYYQRQVLKDLYILVSEEEILNVLKNHPSLIELLLEIPAKIRNYFPDSIFSLEAVPSFEESNESRLMVTLRPPDEAKSVLSIYNRFKEEWWTEAYFNHDQKLAINLEHKSLATSGDPWEVLESLIGTVEGPKDWSKEHDHYLYGTPKHVQK